MRTALVTGGTGFIGGHLVEELINKDYSLRCLVRNGSNTERLEKLASYSGKKIDIIRVNSFYNRNEMFSVCSAFACVDDLFHLAAATHGSKEEMVNANLGVTKNLLDVCKSFSIKRFHFVSSISARGPSNGRGLISEYMQYEPISVYGETKMYAEMAVKESEVPFTIYEPAVVVGPGDREMVPVYQTIKKRGKFVKTGFENNIISFIYVKDLVNALLEGAKSEKTLNQTYVLSDGIHFSEIVYLKMIGDALGHQNIPIYPIPAPIDYLIGLVSEKFSAMNGKSAMLSVDKIREMRNSWACIPPIRFTNDTGWKPLTGLEEAVQKTANWIFSSRK